MMLPEPAISPQIPLREPIYVGTDAQSLVTLEMEGWERGQRAASTACAPLTEMPAIAREAHRACDEALIEYVALDEGRFCDVFTLAWTAGYCLVLRQRGLVTSLCH